ncbi:MAG: PH domain-containing protein [Pseudoxanthomonas sp.]
MKEEFALAPLPRSAWLLLVALWLGLMLVAYLVPGNAQSPSNPVAWWLVIPFATALPLVGLWLMLQHRRISLEGNTLVVAAGLFFRCKLAVSEFALDQARILSLDEHTGFKPMLRLGGIGLPGFSAGRYLLRNRSRAFCLLTARDNVLLLPHGGKYLLISPEKPNALLTRLRELSRQALRTHTVAQATPRR